MRDVIKSRVWPENTLDLATIRLIGPEPESHIIPRIAPELLRETEENLNDMLPEGYSVEVRRWEEK